jgi:hypothetical protein
MAREASIVPIPAMIEILSNLIIKRIMRASRIMQMENHKIELERRDSISCLPKGRGGRYGI